MAAALGLPTNRLLFPAPDPFPLDVATISAAWAAGCAAALPRARHRDDADLALGVTSAPTQAWILFRRTRRGARRRGRACGLEGRADGRRRGDGGGDGSTGRSFARAFAPPWGRASRRLLTKSDPNSSPLSPRRTSTGRGSSSRASRRVARCSICTAISPHAPRGQASAISRIAGLGFLCRRGALLQPRRGDSRWREPGLRAAGLGDRARLAAAMMRVYFEHAPLPTTGSSAARRG